MKERKVETILSQLVEHYAQPLHLSTLPQYPSFDDLLGGPLPVSSVVQHWIQQLVSFQEKEEKEEEEEGTQQHKKDSIIRLWMTGYERYIRPHLLPFTRNKEEEEHWQIRATGIPVLVQYEVVLSQLLVKQQKQKEESNSVVPTDSNHHSGQEDVQQEEEEEERTFLLLADALQCLCRDLWGIVASLSIQPHHNDNENDDTTVASKPLVQNHVLPLLWRLMSHILSMLPPLQNHSQYLSIVLDCTLTLLAFGSPHRLTLDRILFTIHEDLFLLHVTFPFLGGAFRRDERRRLLDFENKSWHHRSFALETPGDDPVTHLATRTAQHTGRALLKYLRQDTNDDTSRNDTNALPHLVQWFHQHNHAHALWEALRATFFGRWPTLLLSRTHPSTMSSSICAKGRSFVYPLPQRAPPNEIKSHPHYPARVFMVLHAVSLWRPDETANGVEFLEDLRPILYELLDGSISSTYVGLAAAALIKVLKQADDNDEWSRSQQETLCHVLQRVLQVHRSSGGQDFVLVLRAATCAFEGVLSEFAVERKQVTFDCLTWMDRYASQATAEEGRRVVVGVLVGGLVPLLRQHHCQAQSQSHTAVRLPADALELGRCGLQVLLPLLQSDEGGSALVEDNVSSSSSLQGQQIQLATLCALQELFLGAYPMLPRHGGKIMCALLACLGHASRAAPPAATNESRLSASRRDDCEERRGRLEWDIVVLAQQVAALALVVCGERASRILDSIVERGDYQDVLVQHVGEIRRLAADMVALVKDEAKQ